MEGDGAGNFYSLPVTPLPTIRYQVDACPSLALPFVRLRKQGNPIADGYLSDAVFLAAVSSSGQCEPCSLEHPACAPSWEPQQHFITMQVVSVLTLLSLLLGFLKSSDT